ncbi:LOW QUALITY PROTEIN: hypothetical protein T265_15428 [Opisthorchis viverrini]|uniref:Uncharacterized protein n=1 Tax=Opisthorchis viverrini TaxID=6198 RepID=A0A074ZXJ1_OPIVI|nr:LOW QUALITY PROTEIN: hypothetical protein T265_15428 [Opisthorchis viverrini]KER19924.1 LOW QUALITY PROTEIN: hypothetical protein T265_15428 [Opisthorchis viverrini]
MDFQILSGTYIRPFLEYANQVVHSGRTKAVPLIVLARRAATRMVAGLKSRSRCLITYPWSTVASERTYFLLTPCFSPLTQQIHGGDVVRKFSSSEHTHSLDKIFSYFGCWLREISSLRLLSTLLLESSLKHYWTFALAGILPRAENIKSIARNIKSSATPFFYLRLSVARQPLTEKNETDQGKLEQILDLVYQSSLEMRITRLRELSRGSPVIRLNTEMFESFARSKARNYSLILMLTAQKPQRECHVCKEAAEEFRIVANSYAYSRREGDLYFGIVDYDEAPDVFVRLKVNTAPSILHVQPNKEIGPEDFMDVPTLGYLAEAVAKWANRRTSIQVTIKFMTSSVVNIDSHRASPKLHGNHSYSALHDGAASLWYRQVNVDFLYSPSLWCMLSLTVIMCGITGQVYNQIRGPPLFHGTHTGEILAFIYPGSDYQFVAETFIVMALYVLATAGIIMIHRVGETCDSGKKMPPETALVGTCVTYAEPFFPVESTVFDAQLRVMEANPRPGRGVRRRLRDAWVVSVLLAFQDGDRVVLTAPSLRCFKVWLPTDASGVLVVSSYPDCLNECLNVQASRNDCTNVYNKPQLFTFVALTTSQCSVNVHTNNGERNDVSVTWVAVVPSDDGLVILIGRATIRNS